MRKHHALALLLVAPLSVASSCKVDGFDRGCITIDGDGGYKNLSDALTLAEDGAVVELCDEPIVESVVVQSAVTIRGLGSATTQWVPPEGEPALTVRGGGDAVVTGVWIQTTADAIVAEAGSGVSLVSSEIASPGGWGIVATDAAVVVDTSVIESAGAGAVHATGDAATVVITDVRFQDNTGWGVLLEDGASGTVTGGVIRGTEPSDDQASEWDGWAVGLKGGATVGVSGTQIDGNVLGMLYAENASVGTVADVDADGNYFAVWAENADVTLTNVSISDTFQYDILGVDGTKLTLDGVELLADPDESPYEDDTNTLAGHYGVLMQNAQSLTVKNSTISGHNGGGIWVIGAVSQNMPMTLENTTITDNGSQGMLIQWVDATLTDVDVTATRDNDAGCLPEDGSILCNWGLAAFSASVDWAGGSLKNSGYIGMIVVEGSADLANVDFADNGSTSLWGESSAISMVDGTMGGWGEVGVYAYDSVLEMERVDFSDRDFIWKLPSGDTEYWFYDQAVDIQTYSSTVTLSDMAFSGGDYGVDLSSTDATVSDLDFTGYHGVAFDQFAGDVDAQRMTFTDSGPNTVRCYGDGIFGASDLTFTNVAHVTSTVETYQGGALSGTSESTLKGPAVTVSTCSTDLSRVTLDGADDDGIRVQNADVELSELSLRDLNRDEGSLGNPAIWISYTSRSPLVIATDVTVTGVGKGAAFSLGGRAADTDGQVSLRRLSLGLEDDGVSGVAGDGLLLTYVGCASGCSAAVQDFDIAGVGGAGIRAVGSYATVQGRFQDETFAGTVAGAGGAGVESEPYVYLGSLLTEDDDIFRDGALVLQDLTVSGTTGAGVDLVAGTHSLADVSVSGAGTDGISIAPYVNTGSISTTDDDVRLEPAVTVGTTTVASPTGSGMSIVGGEHGVTGLTVTGAGEYGMACATDPPDPAEDVPTFLACVPDSLDGTLGALSGCDACSAD